MDFAEGKILYAKNVPTSVSAPSPVHTHRTCTIFIGALQSFLQVLTCIFRPLSPLRLFRGEKVEIRASCNWCCTASGQ